MMKRNKVGGADIEMYTYNLHQFARPHPQNRKEEEKKNSRIVRVVLVVYMYNWLL